MLFSFDKFKFVSRVVLLFSPSVRGEPTPSQSASLTAPPEGEPKASPFGRGGAEGTGEGLSCKHDSERVSYTQLENLKLYYLRLFADVCKNTAVNIENMSVDEVGSIRSKEYCGAYQVLSFAPACRRGLADDEGIERMT